MTKDDILKIIAESNGSGMLSAVGRVNFILDQLTCGTPKEHCFTHSETDFHMPRWKDKFWEEGRGSGYIQNVDYQEEEVTVHFYNNPDPETYTFDEIADCWEPASFGGSYLLYSPSPSK